MKSSLIFRINVRIILAVGLCVLFIGLIEFFQTKSRIENNLDVTLLQASDRLSNSLVAPVWNIDTNVVDGIVATEMLDRNIMAVVVKDSLSDQYILAKTRDEDWNIVEAAEPDALVASRQKNVPLEFKGSDLGSVTVYVTDLFMEDELVAGIAKLVVRMWILLVVVVVVLVILIDLIVSRPLRRLSTVCEKLLARLPISSSLETSNSRSKSP